MSYPKKCYLKQKCYTFISVCLLVMICNSCTTKPETQAKKQSTAQDSSADSTPAMQTHSQTKMHSQHFDSYLRNLLDPQHTTNLAQALDVAIHQEMGVYVLYNPGSEALLKRFASFQTILHEFPYLEDYLNASTCQEPLKDKLPTYDCQNFSAQGCFYSTEIPSNFFSNGILRMADLTRTDISDEEQQIASYLDNELRYMVVITESYLQLGFAQIEGKWYCVLVDMAHFDCSA
ncbi:MAG: hypothetical protein JJT94_11065 [Bernardetiaceae bacterium]|nr:hypothetical protein [Bernardetiaceae bacterium]